VPDSSDLYLHPDVSSPLARVRAIHAYAKRVFDDESRAATWMSRAHESIANGLCAVGAACQEAEGYRQAIAELGRLERLELQRQAHLTAAATPARPHYRA
jgi:hypothetical protein